VWYFSWLLGLGLALTFGVLNAIWYEIREDDGAGERAPPPHEPPAGR
jgi:cyd operon protein YbgT